MRKLLIVGMVAMLSIASTTSFADDGNFFVNGDVGQAHYRVASSSTYDFFYGSYHDSVDKKDTAGALRFGYRWHSVVDYGVEAGYVDLGQTKTKTYSPYGTDYDRKEDQKTRGWLVGGNLKYNIADKWYVSARGGWFRSRNEVEAQGSNAPLLPGFFHYSISSTGTGEYLGLGAGYNILPNLSVGLSYDNYHARTNSSSNIAIADSTNIALYSVSAEYRF